MSSSTIDKKEKTHLRHGFAVTEEVLGMLQVSQ